MARVAQHFNRLQERIQQRVRRRHRIHHHGAAARLQHPARLAQALRHIVPVMGAVARHDQIETAIGKGQGLHRALFGYQIGKPACLRFLCHRAQHVW